jgi:hypothetical protein
MNEHRYNLEKYKGSSTRRRCPGCGKNKTFAVYIDAETNESLSDSVGRCNREIECGYHYAPKQYFVDNDINQENEAYTPSVPKPKQPIAYIDSDVFKLSLAGYGHNNLVRFLHTLFDTDTVHNLITQYNIGSSNRWPGAVTFWYIDNQDHVNYGKIMQYSHVTGKRDKNTTPTHCASALEYRYKKAGRLVPQWLVNYQNNETKINCLFGEHLLKSDLSKPVAVVESEKTAIIASVYLPQFIWLACGSLSNLSKDRCKALKGRAVMLYPDLNAFDKWASKGHLLGFKVSNILEGNATDEDKMKGLDLADYIIKRIQETGNQDQRNGCL